MSRIAISYRRADSSAMTGRIFDRLVARYGKDSIFIDVDNIPLGVDYRRQIEATWQQADLLIAVIGPQWIGEDTDPARIRQRGDPIRVEIETALARELPILPVLVDGATMPASKALPKSLQPLSYINAAQVNSGRDFHAQMERLMAAVDQAVPGMAREERAATGSAPNARADITQTPVGWGELLLKYLLLPSALLVIAQHLIVNSFDLYPRYLTIASFAIAAAFGFLLFRQAGQRLAIAFVLAIGFGIIGVAGMTVAEGLNSGQPILPATRLEWRENAEFIVIIAGGFLIGHALARAGGRLLRARS